MKSRMVSLASSDGCRENWPNPSQRVAPFTFVPTPGTSTSRRRPTLTANAGTASGRHRW